MTPRFAGLGLLAAALAVHFGVTMPAWQAAADSQDAYRRARDARRGLAQRLAAAEKRAAARQQLRDVIRTAAQGAGDAVARLRRDAIAAARQSGVTGVRLEVSPGRGPAAASLRMAAAGSLQAVVALAADLPDTRAVVLDRASLLVAEAGSMRIELNGVRPGVLP